MERVCPLPAAASSIYGGTVTEGRIVPPAHAIRIAIVDNHSLLRLGLKQAFCAGGDFAVVGEGTNGGEALQLVRKEGIDVLVLNMGMAGLSSVDLIKRIKSEKPKLAILALCGLVEEQCAEYAMRAFKAGASACLPKNIDPEELIGAARRLSTGRPYITPGQAEHLALEIGAPAVGDPHRSLSDREYQIFTLLIAGRSTAQIAQELCLSAKTVSTYKTRIKQKTHASNNADLFRYAADHGLLGPQ